MTEGVYNREQLCGWKEVRASLADPASRRPVKYVCGSRKNGFTGWRGRPQMQTPHNGPVKKNIRGICFFTGRLCGFCSGTSATTRKQKNCKSEICHRVSQTSSNSNDINSLHANKSEVHYAKEGMQRYAPMSGIILGVNLHSAPWSPS